MQRLATRPWITAGVALACAGVVAVTPVTAPLPGVLAAAIQLAAEDITLDFVRHGESVDNVDGVLGTLPPGAPLTNLGQSQAIADALALYNGGDNDIGGVYASEFLRTQQTAWPLLQLLHGASDYTSIPAGPTPLLDPSQILPGLNELNAGFLDSQPLNPLTELAYVVAPVMWMLGQYWVPQMGSTTDVNGMAFEDRVDEAVETIYNNSMANGETTDVAFSHAGTIAVWALMNVKNPDFGVLINELLSTGQPVANAGQVVLEGNPTDGWTLVSWDGTPVSATPDLATALFVDFRDLITAPQMALWHIWEALLGGDTTEITNAFETGFNDVGTALLQFPQAVFDDIAAAF